MAIINGKGLVTADVSASASIPLCGSGNSSSSNNSILLLHPRCCCCCSSFSLPHHADATPTAPSTRRDADKLEPGAPRHDDDGAAVFGTEDGADGAVGGGVEEVDAG